MLVRDRVKPVHTKEKYGALKCLHWMFIKINIQTRPHLFRKLAGILKGRRIKFYIYACGLVATSVSSCHKLSVNIKF